MSDAATPNWTRRMVLIAIRLIDACFQLKTVHNTIAVVLILLILTLIDWIAGKWETNGKRPGFWVLAHRTSHIAHRAARPIGKL
jgi:hypothetical protein